MTDTAENFEDIEETELRSRIARGDYHDPGVLKSAKQALKVKEHQTKFEAKCKAASISAALDARKSANRANIIALISLCVAVVSARKEIIEIIHSLVLHFK